MVEGDFKNKFKRSLEFMHNLRERGVRRGEDVLKVCTQLANLQHDLALYLFYVSSNEESIRQLEKPIQNALFGSDKNSVALCLGEDRRGLVEGSLAGAISNLTFWHLISQSSPLLCERLSFSQMVVGGELDAEFAIDVVLDFQTKKNGRNVLRVVQLKTDRQGQIIVERVRPEDLKSDYLGGSFKRHDAERMIKGTRQIYPGCELLFFAVCLPSFDSEPIRNVFGIIHPKYPFRDNLVGIFKEESIRTGLLPKLQK